MVEVIGSNEDKNSEGFLDAMCAKELSMDSMSQCGVTWVYLRVLAKSKGQWFNGRDEGETPIHSESR